MRRRQLDAGLQAIEGSSLALQATAAEAGVSAGFNRLPATAVERMVGLAGDGSPLSEVLVDAGRVGADALADELVKGVALGLNPREIARRAMRQGLATSFTRMATIARTEVLRVARKATLDNYRQSGVCRGWRRLAAKNERTCLACLALDGTVYDLEYEFDQHVACRCTLIPVLKGRPPLAFETGREWFEKQPEATQRRMMGPARFELWRGGKLGWDDLYTVHEDARWGNSPQVRPVRSLPGGAQALRGVRQAAGLKAYYEKSGDQKVMGFTFYDASKGGLLPGVGKAIAAGEDKANGWAVNERIFKQRYLPKHKLEDDVKRTLGLWGAPEPSFNAWVKGSRANVEACSKEWGRAYNQEAMALLLPNKQGTGGALSWMFDRRLTVAELDRVLGGVREVNGVLAEQQAAGQETAVYQIGLTVLGRRRLEFWVANDGQGQVGRRLVEQALRLANLPVPEAGWEGGYDFKLLFRDSDY